MKLFLQILSYWPAVLAGVKAVENEFGNTIPGATKKAMLINSFIAVSKIGEQMPESHIAGVSALIDSTVSDLKSSGIIKTVPSVTGTPATT